jgi:GNAT superfamily N-acetyltransferase
MTYRIAQPNEAHLIAALHTQSWQTAYRNILSDDFLDNHLAADRQSAWQKRFDTPSVHQHILIAENDSKAIGFVCVFGEYDPELGALIDNLHVLPIAKGLGIGKELVRRAATWVYETYSNPQFHLWVYAANTAACGFYEKIGGSRVAEKIYPNPDGSEALIYCYYWSNFPT